MNIFQQFGIDLPRFLFQLLFLSFFLLEAIYASIRVVRFYHSRGAIFLWLALIWFIPILGALSAIFATRSSRFQKAEQGAAANP
jgi:hypothetical protein